MSAPPFFQSAGRGDLLFWGGKEGPTVVIWESLSEQEKESWLEESSTMHDWVVWCKSKKGAEEIRLFELGGKEIFYNDDDCFYYHSWRNNVVIAFGTLSSFLT